MPNTSAFGDRAASAVLALPSTRWGKYALRLFGAAVLLCIVLIGLTLLHLALPDSLDASDGAPAWWLMLPMLAAAGAAALAALAGGVLAIGSLRKGERSGLILLPLACAAIALFFLVGELAFGHD